MQFSLRVESRRTINMHARYNINVSNVQFRWMATSRQILVKCSANATEIATARVAPWFM